jgi:hypothetical protein
MKRKKVLVHKEIIMNDAGKNPQSVKWSLGTTTDTYNETK